MDGCVCCGRYVPEGRHICTICETRGGPDVIISKIKYKDGTEETREFSSWNACTKFILDQSGCISEMDNVETSAAKIRQGRVK